MYYLCAIYVLLMYYLFTIYVLFMYYLCAIYDYKFEYNLLNIFISGKGRWSYE
jgi:hypothetical protein